MAYLKSGRFLVLLFLIVTLVVGCVSMIAVSRMSGQWRIFQERSLPAGYWEETQEVQAEDHHSAQSVSQAWIVRAHGEQIGVFDLNGELEYVVDVYLITLPDADQKLLRDGIYVFGQERLTALMEDYTG